MTQDFPTADQLLDAVAAYLFELRTKVPREERFKLLVAANVCAVVGREIRAGEEPARADLELFGELLGEGPSAAKGRSGEWQVGEGPLDEQSREAAAELAKRIRAGELDDRLDELIDRLPEHVRRKLEIARPGYSD